MAVLNFASGMSGLWTYGSAWQGYQFNTVAYYGSSGVLIDSGDVFHGPRLSARVCPNDNGERLLSDLYNDYLLELGEAGQAHIFPHGLTNGFALELYDFLTAVRDDRPPEIDGKEGLQAKAIANTIYESAASGELVRVTDVADGRIGAYQKPINDYWRI